MTIQLANYLTAHGWKVWAEFHPYFANHARGGWVEWMASRTWKVK